MLDPFSGKASVWKVESEGSWITPKAEIDQGFLSTFIEKYIKDNFSVDVVSWGDNRISFQILLAGKVLSEKTIDIKVGVNNGNV